MRYTRLLPLALLGASLLGACADAPASPNPTPGPAEPRVLGLMEITISGIGTPQMSATATPVRDAAIAAPGGARLAMTQTPSNSIQLRRVSATTVDVGSRASGGQRYIQAVFEVRNADATTGTGYATPRRNLTFVPVGTASSISGTAVARFVKQDGTAANPALAVQLRPTGAVALDGSGNLMAQYPDVLQVFTESEAAAFPIAAGTNRFPYGFMVRHAWLNNTRTLQANPAPELWEGRVTFAFRVPLAPTAPQDAFSITINAAALDDSDTRVTQSLEEQTPAGEAAFRDQAALLGAASVSLVAGGSYQGQLPMRQLCSIRTAGTAASPLASLTPCNEAARVHASPETATGFISDTVRFSAYTSNAIGQSWPDRDTIRWTSSNSSIASVSSTGLVTFHSLGSAVITAAAGGRRDTSVVTVKAVQVQPLSAGSSHACALTSDGDAYCWGSNPTGALGTGNLNASAVPVRVLGGLKFKSVAAGDGFTLALTARGELYAWGGNLYGQLGTGTNTNQSAPVRIAPTIRFQQVAAGSAHAVGRTADGRVYSWGRNNRGQVGDGSYSDSNAPKQVAISSTWLSATVAARGSSTLMLTTAGAAYGWGDNSFGQLGIGNSNTSYSTPAAVAGGRVFSAIALAAYSAVALTPSGVAYGWGERSGDGTTTMRYAPVLVAVPEGLTFTRVAAGDHVLQVLSSEGIWQAWGNNLNGQLGDGTTAPRTSPVPIMGGAYFSYVTSGASTSFGLTSTGVGYSWGSNSTLMLGSGGAPTSGRLTADLIAGGLTFMQP